MVRLGEALLCTGWVETCVTTEEVVPRLKISGNDCINVSRTELATRERGIWRSIGASVHLTAIQRNGLFPCSSVQEKLHFDVLPEVESPLPYSPYFESLCILSTSTPMESAAEDYSAQLQPR